jgi:environmental stress-induced protein Ves
MQILRRDDFASLPWKNGLGVSRIVASEPPRAGYDALLWQVSTTEITADGPFSDLPGMDRRFMLIEGAGVQLAFSVVPSGVPLRYAAAAPYAPVEFRGDWKTHCRLVDGPVRVLNVMTRRDRATAVLGVKRWGGAMLCRQRPGESLLAVMLEGRAQMAGEAAPLVPNDAVLLDSPRGEACEVEAPQGVARIAVVRLTRH